MLDLVREAEYQFTWLVSDGARAYHAPNRAHDLSLTLAADGLHAARYSEEGELLWSLGLSLAAYGGQTFPTGVGEGRLRGNREGVEYHWSRDVVEWYVNSADGVEHGLTLRAPPAGSDGSHVELTFALRGSLTPELDGSGRALRFKDTGGGTVLHYDQLVVYDASGSLLPARFSLSRGGESRGDGDSLHITIDTTNASYPLVVDPLFHSQAVTLTASDAQNNDDFGRSVAISADTIVVGAPNEAGIGNQRGAAYVFQRNQDGADSWGEVTKLTASDAEDIDRFGGSVAISGDTVVVGARLEDGVGNARGAAYLFERNQGGLDSWGEVQKLTASDGADGNEFGGSVAISGDIVVVGAHRQSGGGGLRGAAYVFERNQGGADVWGEVEKLAASDAEDNDRFGCSVAISGETVVVGALYEGGAGRYRGAAYVFERNQGGADNWGEVQKLTASDAADNDEFGNSVAISGDTVVVGASGEDGTGSTRGAAYVFGRNQDGADGWGEVAKLTASDAGDYDRFGNSTAIGGDTVVIGAFWEDGAGENRGAAYVFSRNQGGADQWDEVTKLTASDATDGDRLGGSVGISGDRVVVGADGVGLSQGAAYLFEGGGRWEEVASPRASDAENDDLFGYSAAISGDTAVVGAYAEDGAGSNRGAAYVFARNQGQADGWGEVTRLTASDAQDEDYFGVSVAISGDTVVVGAYVEDGAGSDRGAAYVFTRNKDGADNWGQVTKLTPSDPEDGDRFGHLVAISGDTIVVGAHREDGAGDRRGAAYVFARNQGGADNWGEVQKLIAADAQDGDNLGISVAVSGDTVVAGASGEDGAGDDRGAVYVFERNQGGADTWGQVEKLTASDAQNDDFFGRSVGISGDTIVAGANGEDGGGNNRGAAYVFERNQGGADNWGQVEKLTASDAQDDDWLGFSADISGDTVIAGAYYEDGAGSERGAAYVFERNQGGANNWGELAKLGASDTEDGDNFGRSVGISGGTAVVGAWYEDGAGTARGAAYLFVLQPYRTYLPAVMKDY
jgi:hypothetical protein